MLSGGQDPVAPGLRRRQGFEYFARGTFRTLNPMGGHTQIRDQTGCRVRVVDGVPTCDERVVIISATDEASEVEHSAAQVRRRAIHPSVPSRSPTGPC